jgi:glycosyltransferase involved in cell wall biosynthesis
MQINLLYISYWSSDDPLTSSTVLPHLKIAAELSNINKIILITTERGKSVQNIELKKVEHYPIKATNTGIKIFDRIRDFIRIPIKAGRLARFHSVNLILAKGVLAGAIADKLSCNLGIPYITESFEPHADYMSDSEEWRNSSFKFLYLKKWELNQIKRAKNIITVSENYRQFLEQHYLINNVHTIPCCVNLEAFAYSEHKRHQTRNVLGIGSELTGIYVGRFGGTYYNRESFEIFDNAFRFFKNFRLIILTPQPKQWVEEELKKRNIDLQRTSVLFVQHHEVADYLSAADFAFSLIKPAKSKQFCCPVKDGEYWANGLPVLLTEGIGDDYKILERENGGALFNLEKKNLEKAFHKIGEILKEPSHRRRISEIAFRHRSYSITKTIYERLLDQNLPG